MMMGGKSIGMSTMAGKSNIGGNGNNNNKVCGYLKQNSALVGGQQQSFLQRQK